MPAQKAGQRILRITFQIDDARGKLNDYQVVPLEPTWPSLGGAQILMRIDVLMRVGND